MAGVGHIDRRVTTAADLPRHILQCHRRGRNRQTAAGRHRVHRIFGQVQDRGLQLGGIDEAGRQPLIQRQLQQLRSPMALRSNGSISSSNAFTAIACGCRFCWRANAEKLPGEAGTAFHRALAGINPRFQPIIAGAGREQLQVAANHRQQVVEVVREAER